MIYYNIGNLYRKDNYLQPENDICVIVLDKKPGESVKVKKNSFETLNIIIFKTKDSVKTSKVLQIFILCFRPVRKDDILKLGFNKSALDLSSSILIQIFRWLRTLDSPNFFQQINNQTK